MGKPFLARLRCLTLCLNMLTVELETLSIPMQSLSQPQFLSLSSNVHCYYCIYKACLLNTPKENTCSIYHPHLRDLTMLSRLASNPQSTVILPPLAFLSGILDVHHQAWLARLSTPTVPPALCHQGSNLELNTIWAHALSLHCILSLMVVFLKNILQISIQATHGSAHL